MMSVIHAPTLLCNYFPLLHEKQNEVIRFRMT